MKALFFAALILITTACSDPTGPDPITIRIHGRVIAEATGLPVVGAIVRIQTSHIYVFPSGYGGQTFATTTTGADGSYSLSATLDSCDGVDGSLYLTTSAEGMSDRTYLGIPIECEEGDRTIDVPMIVWPPVF